MIKNIEILFNKKKELKVELKNAEMLSSNSYSTNNSFVLSLSLKISENISNNHSIVTILYDDYGFSFKPVEVKINTPMYYEEENVLIIEKGSNYSLDNIKEYLNKNKKETVQATYKKALNETGGIESSTIILNVPLDARTFELGFRKSSIEEKQHYDLYDYVVPHYNYKKVSDKDNNIEEIKYRYLLGRGMGVNHKIKRRMEEGILPILNASVFDDDLEYKITAFSTLVNEKLEDSKGTDYLLADSVSAGASFSEKQKKRLKKLDFNDDAPALLMKIEVVNHSLYPLLSFVRLPHINTFIMSETKVVEGQYFDSKYGYGKVNDKVYMIARLNGKNDNLSIENTVLVDKIINYEILLFHKPIKEEDAEKYYNFDFDKEHKKVKKYYKSILKNKARISTPERLINELWDANYIQMRQNCFGENGSNSYAPCVGVYNPIGSESYGIISYLAAFGDTVYAKNTANYFFIKQREDGFIQNIDGYMLETGGALLILRDVYLYNRDKKWLKTLEKHIIKAVNYLSKWIDRNSINDGRNGFGMIDGRVADPVDNKRIYMLNGNCYAGLYSAYMLLKKLNNSQYAMVLEKANTLKDNIIKSLIQNMIYSPLSPLKNGTYLPFISSWADEYGASSLSLNGGSCVSHATFMAKDSLLSATYLIKYGVLDVNSSLAKMILKVQKDICLTNNTAFSQPYYSPIPYANIRAGNINDYIEEFYYALAGLSDKETYYFWEHFFLATPHKTSEQGFFSMRLKEIFAYEDFDRNELVVFKAIPDNWVNKKNNTIEVKNLNTMLGKLSVKFTNKETFVYHMDIDFIPFDKNTKIVLYLPIRKNEAYIDDTKYIIIDSSIKAFDYKTK